MHELTIFLLIPIFYTLDYIINKVEKYYYTNKTKKLVNKYTEFTLIYLKDILNRYTNEENYLSSLLKNYYSNEKGALNKIKENLLTYKTNKKLSGPGFVIQILFFNLANLNDFYFTYEDIPKFIKENFIIVKYDLRFMHLSLILQPKGSFHMDLQTEFFYLENRMNEYSFIEDVIYPERIVLFYFDGVRGKKLKYFDDKCFYFGDKVYFLSKLIFKDSRGEYFYLDDLTLNEGCFENVFRICFVVLESVK